MWFQVGRGWVWLVLLVLVGCEGDPLSGVSADLSINPPTLVFGETWVGSAVEKHVTLSNAGGVRALVEKVWVTGPGFELAASPPFLAAAGGRTSLPVRFTPSAEGPHEGQLRLQVTGRELTAKLQGEGKPVPDCDDGNPCTVDRFEGERGACRHEPRTGACDDGNACTSEDRCQLSACVGKAVSCDDGLACTVDGCDATNGCVHVVACDDGNPCTSDGCGSEGACVNVPAADDLPCGESSQCAVDLCRAGQCRSVPVAEGAICDDGDACTQGEQCTAGLCLSAADTCDDGNPCTEDICEVAGCTHTALPDGTVCGETGACIEYYCMEGQCSATTHWTLADWVDAPGGVVAYLGEQLWSFVANNHRTVDITEDEHLLLGPVHQRPETLIRSADLEGGPFLDTISDDADTRWWNPTSGEAGSLFAPPDVAVFSVRGTTAWAGWPGVVEQGEWTAGGVAWATIDASGRVGEWSPHIETSRIILAIRARTGGRALVDTLRPWWGGDFGRYSYYTVVLEVSDGPPLLLLRRFIGEKEITPIKGDFELAGDRLVYRETINEDAPSWAQVLVLTPEVHEVAHWSDLDAYVRPTLGFDGHTAVFGAGSVVQLLRLEDSEPYLDQVGVPAPVSHARVLPQGILVTGENGMGLIVPLCPGTVD